MFKYNVINKLILVIFLSQISYCKSETLNTVDHKDSQLNLYLDLIRYNLQEKLGIIPYILKNGGGKYLEVGTGGDPIALLLSKIPANISPTIIASDIDQNILDVLPIRHPKLNKYLNQQENGPVLKLQQLDATSMTCFKDNELDGINASAVVHEIVSYAGGMDGFESFFKESLRVLKSGGVLIYRDPESVFDKKEMVVVHFKSPSMRLFTHIFLYKYLDCKHGSLASSGRKQVKYDPVDITFTVYKKNISNPCILSFDQYLNLQSYEIDFLRPYSISMPRGLCREVERHYLTYLHQCNPLVYLKCLPTVDSESYFVNYLAHSTRLIFDDFLKKNNLDMVNSLVDVATKRMIDAVIDANGKAIEYGIPVSFTTKSKERLLFSLLKQHGFDPNRYVIPFKDHCYLIDYRIFGLLYDYFAENIFDSLNGPVNNEDQIHAQWLKREGEETYIYYSDDELITHVAEICLKTAALDDKNPFVLCPVDAEQNRFVPRLCYEEVLRDSIEINDLEGYPRKIKEGKRIIHFAKKKLEDALTVFADIVASDPERYVLLQEFIDSVVKTRLLSLSK